jgi:hypothetical protein
MEKEKWWQPPHTTSSDQGITGNKPRILIPIALAVVGDEEITSAYCWRPAIGRMRHSRHATHIALAGRTPIQELSLLRLLADLAE